MGSLYFSVLYLVGLAGSEILSAQIVAPDLIQKVEPEYSADLRSYVLDPARVEMIVDERGFPLALNATTGLPNNVVQALAKWRFRPKRKNGIETPFTVLVDVPIRRPINEYLQSAGRPASLEEKHELLAAKSGATLTPGKAAELEKKLKENAESVEGRIELLAYAAATTGEDAAQMRARQISWLVRNRLGSGVLGTPLALIFATPGPLQDAAAYDLIKGIWLDQVSKDPSSAIAVGHATWFLQLSDPEKAEQLLIPVASSMGGAAAWLGELYGFAVLGVMRLDVSDGAPTVAGERLPEAGYALHARSMLASTKDERILLSALATITKSGRQLSRIGRLRVGYAEYCRGLLSRVQVFDPDTQDSCDVPPPAPNGAANPSHQIEPARLVKKVTPSYPPEALSRRIQAAVHFSALIGKDGKLKDLQLLSSPLLFYDSSRMAVLGWEYRPTMLNGEPVEVITQIDVNYTLRN